MNTRIGFLLVTIGLTLTLSAAPSKDVEKWADGPVRWLLTDAELAEWRTLDRDEDALRFIELFWARRDPTPGTAVNEMRLGFEQRVEIADHRFSSGNTPGSSTERGRVFLLLGAPYRVTRTSDAPQSTHQSGLAGSVLNARGEQAPAEVWYYEKENRPAFAGGIDFDVTFIDYYGNKDYRMVMTGKRGVNDLLLKARELFVVQPDLKALPALSIPAPGSAVEMLTRARLESESLRRAYETARNAPSSTESRLHLTYGESLTPSGEYYVPVQLYAPARSGLDTSGELTFFGVVENEGGEIVAVYEEPVMLVASNNDAYYDRTLMLAPGEYVGTFGLARQDVPIALLRSELSLAPLEPGATSLSRLILSNNIYPLTRAQGMTDPYAFGGLKVVPKGDRAFRRMDEVWYFLVVRNPRLNSDGVPALRIQLSIEGVKSDGVSVKMSAPMSNADAHPVRDTSGHFMIGSSFPAGTFKPGSYTIEARILDANGGESWTLQESFTIID